MDRRFFLTTGFVAMLFNSVYQYSWNAFFPLLVKGFNSSPSAIEVGFTLFVISSTSFQVLSGRLSDLRGPKLVGSLGALAFSLGLILSSLAPNLPVFYATWTLGSVGEGTIYGISLNLAIKWYGERRGLASGLVSMGFGLGGAIANPFIELSHSFRVSMLVIGVISLGLLPLFILSSYPGNVEGTPPGETVRETRFWLIYASFVLASIPLLVTSSSLGELGDYLSEVQYAIATVYFPVASGVGRPIMGYLTDRLGRLRGIDYMIAGILLGTLLVVIGDLGKNLLLLVGVALVGVMGGTTYPLFSALVGDLYGPRYSTANTSLLYTGKIVSGVLGSLVFSSLFQFNDELGLGFLMIATLLSLVTLAILHQKITG
ncbi:hypothetical protein L3N51_02318 [Metallosphaera sp. J1]|nr:hypothetical protein [Metallosphaera javensis (ex Hofmann et al. 2022)]BCS93064.1 MAG: oxalate/formate antiport family MFS transporter [Metallosphaera javensis (ex Sakai et al. 2022)]